jgi:hypothetical protein
MSLTRLRLLRPYSDTGSLEKPQRKSAGAYAHGYRRTAQHAARHHPHRLTRKKSKLSQALANLGRGSGIRR